MHALREMAMVTSHPYAWSERKAEDLSTDFADFHRCRLAHEKPREIMFNRWKSAKSVDRITLPSSGRGFPLGCGPWPRRVHLRPIPASQTGASWATPSPAVSPSLLQVISVFIHLCVYSSLCLFISVFGWSTLTPGLGESQRRPPVMMHVTSRHNARGACCHVTSRR